MPEHFGRKQEYAVDFERIALQQRVSSMAIQDARFEFTPDQLSRDMIARLTAYVASNKVHEDSTTTVDEGSPHEISRETKHTQVPSTWWDYAKATYENSLSKGSRWTRGLRFWLRGRIHTKWDTITTTERVYMQTKTTTTINRTVHMCPHMQPDQYGQQMRHVLWLHDENNLSGHLAP